MPKTGQGLYTSQSPLSQQTIVVLLGPAVGARLGATVGAGVGHPASTIEPGDGTTVGSADGIGVGSGDGLRVGLGVGAPATIVGSGLGICDGFGLGNAVGGKPHSTVILNAFHWFGHGSPSPCNPEHAGLYKHAAIALAHEFVSWQPSFTVYLGQDPPG